MTCSRKEELDRQVTEKDNYQLLTYFLQEQKYNIVQATNVIELLESVEGAKLLDEKGRGAELTD